MRDVSLPSPRSKMCVACRSFRLCEVDTEYMCLGDSGLYDSTECDTLATFNDSPFTPNLTSCQCAADVGDDG
jgi:hypothetical protein